MALDPDHLYLRIRIRDSGYDAGEYDRICSIVRALFYCNGNSNGQALKNKSFKSGATVTFGTGPMRIKFAESIRRFVKKIDRDNIEMSDG